MRIKLLVAAATVAALLIGATSSQAVLNTTFSTSAKIKKPGAPATVHMVIDNNDDTTVPQRVASVTIKSKIAKFNAKAIPQCMSDINTQDTGEIVPACPKASKVGTGTGSVITGIVGQPIPDDLGRIDAFVTIYNYKTSPGDQAALLLETVSDKPVPNGHVYQVAHVSKSGTIFSTVPRTTDLPPAIASALEGRTITLSHLETTIKSPPAKKGKKPFFTLTSVKNMDFSVTLARDNG